MPWLNWGGDFVGRGGSGLKRIRRDV